MNNNKEKNIIDIEMQTSLDHAEIFAKECLKLKNIVDDIYENKKRFISEIEVHNGMVEGTIKATQEQIEQKQKEILFLNAYIKKLIAEKIVIEETVEHVAELRSEVDINKYKEIMDVYSKAKHNLSSAQTKFKKAEKELKLAEETFEKINSGMGKLQEDLQLAKLQQRAQKRVFLEETKKKIGVPKNKKETVKV